MRANILERNVLKIKDYLDMNLQSMMIYKDTNIDIYITKLSDNSIKIFKTIRGKFAYDLLDYSYLNGLELLCLDDKLVLEVIKTNLKDGYETVSTSELRKILLEKVKASYLIYLVYDKERGFPYTIKLNMKEYEDLSYVELKDIIFYTYKKKVNSDVSLDNLKICLIDFVK